VLVVRGFRCFVGETEIRWRDYCHGRWRIGGFGVLVTQRQRVFERLMAGDSLDQVRRDISSASAQTRGIQMYVEHWEKNMPEFQGEVRGLERKREKLNGDHQKLLRDIIEAEILREELDRGLTARRTELEEIDLRFVETKSELEVIKLKLDALEEHGLTEEAIIRVGKIDFGSEDELLDRIGTVERYQELERAKGHLEEELADKMKEYQSLLAELKSLGEAVASEENELDEVRRRRVLHEEAYRVVEGFLQEGYDADLLLGILEPLKSLSVKGQPLTSLRRLLDGLSGYQRLTELQEECTRKETELAQLTRESARVEATLNAMKDTVLKALEEAKKSMGMIDRQGSEALELSKSLVDQYTLHLNKLEKGQIFRSEKLSKIAEANIIITQNEAIAKIETIMNNLKTRLEQYEYGVRVWGEEKEKMGRLKDVMPYAEIIYDNYVRNVEVPIEIVFRLVYFMWIWIHTNLPNEMISPTKEIANEDRSFNEYSSYKLTSMIDMLQHYFTQDSLRTK